MNYIDYKNKNLEYIQKHNKRFLEVFDVKNRKDTVFSTILNFDTEKSNSSFSAEDYFKLLYTETSSLKKVNEEIIDNFKFETKFQIIHSFAKNGKSTFLKHLQYNKKRYISKGLNLIFINFDFSSNTTNSNASPSSFKNTVHSFFEYYLFNGGKINIDSLEAIKVLNKFIDEISIDQTIHLSEKKYHEIKTIFFPFRNKLTQIINEYDSSTEFEEVKQQNFFIKFNEILNSFGEEKAGEILVYIILLRLINLKDQFSKEIIDVYENSYKKTRNRIVVVFDNIDDITSHIAKEIATNQAFYLSKFMDIYFTFLCEFKKLFKNFIFNEDVYFIYSYRTANFVNAFQVFRRRYFLNESQKNRYTEYFYNAKKFKITTVKESACIIEYKFWFYKTLCEINNVDISPKYYFFDYLNTLVYLNSRNPDDIDLSQVYRLWNGNRSIIFNSQFFRQFENLNIDKIDKDFIFLEKGTYLHFFLKPFYDTGYYETNLSTIITKIFREFNNCTDSSKCELSRLLFNVIINTLQESNNRLRRIDDCVDLIDKGISLFELLNTLQIKNKDGASAYSLDEINEFLNLLFYEEIDAWGHLLTCTKTTTYEKDQDLLQGKLLTFDNEFSSYKEIQKGCSNESLKLKLKDIKFFYNDNAYYLVKYVLPNFEYFSVFTGVKKPLKYLIDYRIFENEYKFDFSEVINKILGLVNCLCKSSITCYREYFLEHWTPKEYCETKLSFNNTFHFKDVISRHITYLDQFRRYLLKNSRRIYNVENNTLEKLQYEINIKLTYFLKKYLDLYFTTFESFKDMGDLPQSLIDANHVFLKLSEILETIEKKENLNKNIVLEYYSTK